MAIRAENFELVDFLLSKGVPTHHESCDGGPYGSPLHAAVDRDSLDLVARLIEDGAKPNVLCRPGDGPLWHARSAAVARLLLDAGADVHSRTGFLDSLIDTACRGRADNYGETPLCFLYDRTFGVSSSPSSPKDPRPPSSTYRIMTLLVAAGDRSWACVPTHCLGLEAALVSVWENAPKGTVEDDLAQLFQRLKPAVQKWIQAALRGLHHGARPFDGLPEHLRIKILGKALE